jgi:hypothetical protein
MDTPINPARIRKALSSVKQAVKELEDALAEADLPKPNLPPPGDRVKKPRRSLRRIE